MEVRRKLSYPPYYYLIYIKVIGKDYNKISIESNKIASILTRELKNSKILGPTTCSVFK
jgi:primosomal protein N'